MKMSKMVPMALLAALPMAGMAQKSGLKMENLDKNVKPAEDFCMFAACEERLRPILMTVVTMIAGMRSSSPEVPVPTVTACLPSASLPIWPWVRWPCSS